MTTGLTGQLTSTVVDHRLGAVVTFHVAGPRIPEPRLGDGQSTVRPAAIVLEVERRPGSVLMIRHHEVGSSHELASLIQAASDAAGLPDLERLRARTGNRLMLEDAVPERRFLRALGSQLRPGQFALVILCSPRDAAALHRVMARTHPDVAKASLAIEDQDRAIRDMRTSGLAGLFGNAAL